MINPTDRPNFHGTHRPSEVGEDPKAQVKPKGAPASEAFHHLHLASAWWSRCSALIRRLPHNLRPDDAKALAGLLAVIQAELDQLLRDRPKH